jgi:DNA mismatch endonuclease, patch repair protein
MRKTARSPETTHRIMSAIRSKDTKPEKILGKAIWKLGLRYRKQYRMPGRPDFALVAAKVAIFCDGDFWHGNNWKIRGLKSLRNELKGYKPFWRQKILSNIERDKKVNKVLKKEGWYVIRFFESAIRNSPEICAKKVLEIYSKRKGK